jgi:hypothetical protein
MKFFVVVLALAVTAWTQATAFEPLHHRHSRMTRQAEANDGCPAYRHRGVSGVCVLNPDKGPYKPDPYWTPCDYSCSTEAPECCGGP